MDVKKQVFNIGNNKLGSGEVQFCWQPGCRWLAFVGETKVIVLVDRLGKTIVEFQLKSGGRVKYMEFDSDGDTLALFQENSSIVTVINVHSKKVFDMEIERNNKDIPSCIKWGKKDSILAVCTELGLIYIYSKITSKLIPTALTHSSAIISCDWNEEGNLITGAKDNCLSITSKLGTSVSSGTKLKENPRMVKWAKIKADKNSDTTNTVSFIQGNKALIIFNPIKKTMQVSFNI